eukprot:2007945-Amphidinium_carterae.1
MNKKMIGEAGHLIRSLNCSTWPSLRKTNKSQKNGVCLGSSRKGRGSSLGGTVVLGPLVPACPLQTVLRGWSMGGLYSWDLWFQPSRRGPENQPIGRGVFPGGAVGGLLPLRGRETPAPADQERPPSS